MGSAVSPGTEPPGQCVVKRDSYLLPSPLPNIRPIQNTPNEEESFIFTKT